MQFNYRNTTADYLRNFINNGSANNLQIKLNTYANRLIISNNNQVSAVSVVSNGVSEIYYVGCSVILAGGVIKSTQLIQVSGIGAQEDLDTAGIP